MALLRSSNVRAAAFRSDALNFKLGERLFDRIEVRAIGRQIAQRRASSLDRFPDTGDFVGWQVVHHDDIALAQGRREKMFDIGEETRGVHGPIEHARRGDRIATQGRRRRSLSSNGHAARRL